MTQHHKTTSTASRPELPNSTAGRRALVIFGFLTVLKGVGWILIAQAIATAITPFAINPASADTPSLIALLTPTIEPWQELPAGANLGVALTLGVAGAGLRAVAAWGIEVVANRVALGEKEHYRHRILSHRLRTGTEQVGEDTALMTRGLDGLDDYYSKYWPAIISTAIIPLMLGAWILWHDWVSAVVIVLTIPLIPIFMILIGQHTEERVEQAADGLSRISQHLYELARGLPALVGLRRANTHGKALKAASTEYRKTTMETLRTAFMSSLALELIATLSVAVIAVFIGVRLVYGNMNLFDGLVVLVLAAEVYLPFREVGSAFHSSEDGLESLRRVRQQLDQPGPQTITATTGETLSVTDLSLKYDGAADPILEGAALEVVPGEFVVLGSASGTGKSTVLKALAGVPVHGLNILVGHSCTVPETRLYLSQHPVFTETTVADELHLYRKAEAAVAEDPLVEKVLQLTSATHLHSRVIAQLSPGEQRRVALARVLYRALQSEQPAYLFLDEPTAHLDEHSAQVIRTGLARLRTEEPQLAVLAASHDTALHAQADRVLEFTAEHTLRRRASQPVSPEPEPCTAATSATATGDVETAETDDSPAAIPAAETHRWKGLWKILPVKEPRFLGGILMAVVTVLSASALAALSGWLIVQASYQPPVLFLLAVIVGVRFFGIGRAVSRYTERLITHRAILDWATALRSRLWDALATNIKFWPVLTRRGGALKFLISDVDEIRDVIPRVLVPIPAALLSWLATIGLVWLIIPEVVPVVVLAGVLGLLVMPAITFWVAERTQQKMAEHRGWVMGEVSLLLNAAPELFTNGLTSRVLQRFAAQEKAHGQDVTKDALTAGLGQAAAVATSAAAAVIAVVQSLHLGLEAPMAALLGFLLLSLSEPFGQMVEATQQAGGLRSRLRALGPLLQQETSTEHTGQSITQGGTQGGTLQGIRARGITAQYPGTDAPVFQNVSVQVSPGELTMVTGGSGTGKSTLLAILLGFLPPDKGTYELQVRDPADLRKQPDGRQQLLARIAWCPQEAYLFNSTVEGNLALARDRAEPVTHAQMVEALELVGLKPWFEKLPQGLGTRIGAGGSHLSGGQRQRLALARALLTQADILLLDEPTAHLGEDEAAELMRDLRALKEHTGILLVTHQREYLQHADHHVELGDSH